MIVFDIETDGFNPTKIHCLSLNWGGKIISTADYDSMRKVFLREDVTLVGHNITCFDIPVIERILEIKVKAELIDTLALSWYLYSDRSSHALASWGEEFGVPKPEVEDWEGLSYEEYAHRCEEDVKINTLLWKKIDEDLNKLYDSPAIKQSLIRYLSFKMHTVMLQERSGWKLDVTQAEKSLAELEEIKEKKTSELAEAMPEVEKVGTRTRPKVMYRKDGSLSKNGHKWLELLHRMGLPKETEEVEVVVSTEQPNPESPTQIKDWLLSLGWKPQTFSEGANGKVPQIYTQSKDICPSVLAINHPAIEYLDGLGVLKHRIGILKGFLRDVEGGRLRARISGFTSTLRMRHKEIVNLPKPSVPYGELVRGVLIADDGCELCNSDLASLEDRTKQHFIFTYDPEYVKSMMVEGFDPHLDLAVFAGALTKEQAQAHKDGKEDHGKIRHQYKTVNYAATYGIGAAKLAKTLDIPKSQAAGIIDAYWKRNWAIKAFSESCTTKSELGKTWIKNPLNKFWYELRSAKDKFSAVNQSAGDFICYLWIKNVLNKRPQLTGAYHDELTICVKQGHRPQVEKLLRESIQEVNKKLKLNREMDIGIGFGHRYSDIH
jgi:hypothetical protein